MGCDIHFYVERREAEKWVSCDAWETEDGDKSVPYGKSFYDGRNYDLFAILADVRNGRGFAGSDTGDGFIPIAAPRGIPDDASNEYRGAAEAYGCDGHSHSWFTVAELQAYNWTQVSAKRGIVNLKELARWKMRKAPESWSSGITGTGIKIFDSETGVVAVDACISRLKPMAERLSWWTLYHVQGGHFGIAPSVKLEPDERALIEALYAELGCTNPHFKVSWPVSYYEAAGKFLGETLPRLWRLGKPEDVRICFFFDN